MTNDLGKRLKSVIDAELPALKAATPAEPAKKDAWSIHEELGHLIDSATNNHVRFVRATLEAGFEGPSYDQNGWVRLHRYNDLPWPTLVDFWYSYNGLLAHLIGQIPAERLNTKCNVASAEVTLEFLIEDYILHMQHHIDHVLRRPVITQYPGAQVGV